jgi:hypothetical protein
MKLRELVSYCHIVLPVLSSFCCVCPPIAVVNDGKFLEKRLSESHHVSVHTSMPKLRYAGRLPTPARFLCGFWRWVCTTHGV